MLVKKITYADYDGVERTETFYFNLTKSEITELQLTYPGGYAEYIERVVDSKDRQRLMELFKDLIFRTYGEKSEDGKRMIKSKELSEAFAQTLAYDELFMSLCTDPNEAIAFVSGVMPDFGNPQEKERIVREARAKLSSQTE